MATQQPLAEIIATVQNKLHAGAFSNEAEIRQGVVLPLLQALGWPVFDVELVRPEYNPGPQLGAKRVDFALCPSGKNPAVFVEVKALGKVAQAHVQLREYMQKAAHQIQLGIATDGASWDFFCAQKTGAVVHFQSIALLNQAPAQSAALLLQLLSRKSVKSGAALTIARGAAGAATTEQAPARKAGAAGVCWFCFEGGEKTYCDSNAETAAGVVNTFMRRDPEFIGHFAAAGGNPYAARSSELLFPGNAEKQRSRTLPLHNGWFMRILTRHDRALKQIRAAYAAAAAGEKLTVCLRDNQSQAHITELEGN